MRISLLWKLKDPDKLVEALSWIINATTDLQRLASGHRTEVVSGSIEIIYRLPDENRVTRRLSIMCEKSYDGETL